ncbi:hypothetical protein [Thalassospira sp.]|uniref:hypothetical protein n=1 Tax=Thalassospira sp. TaxID=1912094 RepID=UPI0032EC7360
MHIGTNSKNTKLTRPVAMWKRLLAGFVGIIALLVALGALMDGEGWVTLIPLAFGIGSLIFASNKYETIG